MPPSFAHLHTHSNFSLLDGLGRIPDLVQAAKDAGMSALALTDHGTMHGAVELVSEAQKAGIKPIVGCEVYLADRPLDEKAGPGARNFHLTLLAENEAGYRNLVRLTTEAHLRGFYRKPRVDHRLLRDLSDGIICLSGCASGELAAIIQSGDLTAAEERADWYGQTFPGRYFLEMQDHGLDIQRRINEGVVHLHRKLGLPLVATNDVHYVEARQAHTHEILLCVQTQTTLDDPKRMRLESNEFFLKSPEQMAALFADFPEAISNTAGVAERCNFQIKFGRPQVPQFKTPNGQDSESYLRTLCEDGLARRYGSEKPSHARVRLDYELSVISRTGFVDYLLLCHDVVQFARRAGIAVGPGRGSAAGSLVCYVLHITGADPLKHGLSFERFLNPERVTMPDMDLDFADDRRDEVFRYVSERYGHDHVAQIITFGTFGARSGIRDVGRVMGLSYSDTDRVAKLIPAPNGTIALARETVTEFRDLYESDSAIKQLVDTAEDLEGVARHASTHAAGVVISKEPLAEHVPLYKVPKNDQVTTQYSMGALEKIGLLKMDFLGLRTLTILQRACDFVRASRGIDLDINRIDVEDESIYRLLSSGETFGVFQFDGEKMRDLLRSLKPDRFEHVMAVSAMYRPGPMENIPQFVERHHGRQEVVYIHPSMKEVLEESHGIFVYQEQVMSLFNRIAGYSLGEADLVRRAMAKKHPAELAKHRDAFLDRAEERGTDRQTGIEMWNIVEPFAGYAFNKSHTVAYGLITCMTAYLKANYPVEFMAGILSAERDNADKISLATRECRRLGIAVHRPDVNHSQLDFALESDGVRFGLGAIKHVGTGAAESVIEERLRGGPFSSIEDFCARVDWSAVNKRLLESLAQCGALDSLGVERGRLVKNLDRLHAFGVRMHRAAALGQESLFGDVGQPEADLYLDASPVASPSELVAWERELLGIALSPGPGEQYTDEFRAVGAVSSESALAADSGTRLRVGGVVRDVRPFSSKAGKSMGDFQLVEAAGSLSVRVFNRAFEKCGDVLVAGRPVVVDGRIESRDGGVRLLADAVYSLGDAPDQPAQPNGTFGRVEQKPVPRPDPLGPSRRVRIQVTRSDDRKADLERLEQLYAVLQEFSGQDEVELLIRNGERIGTLSLPNPCTRFCDSLERRIREIWSGAQAEVLAAAS
ncbi:MAG: DNA polymerase III subunit alpha [Chloroflexota bacterium]